MTHVTVTEDFLKPTSRRELNDDNIGYVESYDFSHANVSQESRIAAITTIASVCYQSPNALGSISLYDRLATENKGLPSSSYEFVPVLISFTDWVHIMKLAGFSDNSSSFTSIEKYGEWVKEGNEEYLLTNLRALIADVGVQADQYFFNTEEECQIIAKHFKVYKTKIDLSTARQFMRHRASWQELSRRYVSGKRAEFEFYISPKMKNLISEDCNFGQYSTDAIIQDTIRHYNTAIAAGIKPEEARRILPQAMYTTVWSAWQPKQLEVFYKLRCDAHSQAEIQSLAYAMKDLEATFISSEAKLS